MDLKKISDSMSAAKLDRLLILKPENINYVSGFRPSGVSAVIIGEDTTL